MTYPFPAYPSYPPRDSGLAPTPGFLPYTPRAGSTPSKQTSLKTRIVKRLVRPSSRET